MLRDECGMRVWFGAQSTCPARGAVLLDVGLGTDALVEAVPDGLGDARSRL